VIATMGYSCAYRVGTDDPSWLSERAQRIVWWTLVAFAAVDWISPQLALTQEWWCILLILWIVPWRRSIPEASSLKPAMTWISSLILFAWLVSRTEKAVHEALSGWIIFRSPLLSHAWRATVSAFVSSLVTIIPLRRVLGEHSVKPIAVLASLPYSSRLGGHAISPFMMVAVIGVLRWLGLHREQIPGYMNTRRAVYRILRGELNAGVVFMLYASVWLLTLWLMTTWSSREESSTLSTFISLICTVAFPWVLSALVLAAIAAWRSLTTRTHRNFITENLKTLVRVLILLTIFPAALGGFFLGIPYSGMVVSEAVTRSAGPGWSITTSDSGHEIRVTGEIRPGLSDALTEILEATPGVERLQLESPGGSVREGLALANLVEKYSLDTAVKTYCASACTMIFVAGRERILSADAELGFHRCRSLLWFDAFLYDDQHNAELVEYFRSKRVSKAFADKVISVPSDDVWYPSLDQLLAAGVVTAASNSET
jgi:hypothetical protein